MSCCCCCLICVLCPSLHVPLPLPLPLPLPFPLPLVPLPFTLPAAIAGPCGVRSVLFHFAIVTSSLVPSSVLRGWGARLLMFSRPRFVLHAAVCRTRAVFAVIASTYQLPPKSIVSSFASSIWPPGPVGHPCSSITCTEAVLCLGTCGGLGCAASPERLIVFMLAAKKAFVSPFSFYLFTQFFPFTSPRHAIFNSIEHCTHF